MASFSGAEVQKTAFSHKSPIWYSTIRNSESSVTHTGVRLCGVKLRAALSFQFQIFPKIGKN
eukprot:3447596-Rhodomonas_salina.2